jgi:hypothetical protein
MAGRNVATGAVAIGLLIRRKKQKEKRQRFHSRATRALAPKVSYTVKVRRHCGRFQPAEWNATPKRGWSTVAKNVALRFGSHVAASRIRCA